MTSILKVDTIQDADGNNIINESSNTITVGASGDTITIPAGATITNSGTATGFGGITMLQQWYLSSTYAISGSSETRIASTNWAKASSISGRGITDIGSSMTASSGIFTFPSTGIYTVEFQTTINPGDDTNYQTGIRFTTNDSTYNRVAWAYIGFETDGNPPSRGNAFVKATVDVTDTTNCKIDTFGQDNDSVGINVMGDGSPHTSLTFTRIGDT